MSLGVERIYEQAGMGASFTWGARPAVLVVDLSLGFTDPACPLGADLSSEVVATRRLLDESRRLQLPIIFTTVAFQNGLADAGIWLQKIPAAECLVLGSRWVEIDPRLARRDDEPVLVKKAPSAFFGTNLTAILNSQRVDTVVLCGATTSGCIRATAVDLLQHGYPTLVPRECVGDRAREPHAANLFDIQAKYADVVSLDQALAYLAEAATATRVP
jgi:maleamate amidohydrolase